jgi:hypothetical protein
MMEKSSATLVRPKIAVSMRPILTVECRIHVLDVKKFTIEVCDEDDNEDGKNLGLCDRGVSRKETSEVARRVACDLVIYFYVCTDEAISDGKQHASTGEVTRQRVVVALATVTTCFGSSDWHKALGNIALQTLYKVQLDTR